MPTNKEIDSLAAKLYHECYPRSNWYSLNQWTTSYTGFRTIAENILKNKYNEPQIISAMAS